jgi:hypothetical protein
MNLEQFEDADSVMRLLWNNQTKYYKFSQICKELNFSDYQLRTVLAITMPDKYIERPHKLGEDGDAYYVITDLGKSFFNKTNYVTEYKRLHKQTPWYQEYIKELIVGIILLALGTYLSIYFKTI